MAKMYYDKDADLSLIQAKKVAVIGYGSQGHAHALNLKDSGVDVRVGLAEGSASRGKAERDGLRALDVADAVREADVVMVLTPDHGQARLYKESIEPNLKPGSTLMFAHGFNIRFGTIKPPSTIDVSMIAPKSPGHRVRELYKEGGGTPALLAVHQDATGKARELALRFVDRAGRIRQYMATLQPVRNEPLPANRLVVALRDVTDLRESEERLLVAAHALEGMTEAIMITSVDGTVQTVNRAFTAVTGYTSDEVLGRPESELRGALQPPSFYQEVYSAVEREGYWSGTTWSKRKNGSVYREWRSVRLVRDANGKPTHYVIVFYELGTPPVQLGTGTGGLH